MQACIGNIKIDWKQKVHWKQSYEPGYTEISPRKFLKSESVLDFHNFRGPGPVLATSIFSIPGYDIGDKERRS